MGAEPPRTRLQHARTEPPTICKSLGHKHAAGRQQTLGDESTRRRQKRHVVTCPSCSIRWPSLIKRQQSRENNGDANGSLPLFPDMRPYRPPLPSQTPLFPTNGVPRKPLIPPRYGPQQTGMPLPGTRPGSGNGGFLRPGFRSGPGGGAAAAENATVTLVPEQPTPVTTRAATAVNGAVARLGVVPMFVWVSVGAIALLTLISGFARVAAPGERQRDPRTMAAVRQLCAQVSACVAAVTTGPDRTPASIRRAATSGLQAISAIRLLVSDKEAAAWTGVNLANAQTTLTSHADMTVAAAATVSNQGPALAVNGRPGTGASPALQTTIPGT